MVMETTLNLRHGVIGFGYRTATTARDSRSPTAQSLHFAPRISGDVELVVRFRLRGAPVRGRADAVVIAAVQGDPQRVTLALRRRNRDLDVPSVELLVPHTVRSSD